METKEQSWIFRVATNSQYGGGHLSRSLQLAKHMVDKASVCFWVDDDFPSTVKIIHSHGFNDITFVPPASHLRYDGIWIDHYGIDPSLIKNVFPRILVAGISDDSRISEGADVVFSYTPLNKTGRAEVFHGFCYALVAPDYALLAPCSSDNTLRATLFFGQTDSYNCTTQTLKFLKDIRCNIKINVVMGMNNLHGSEIRNALSFLDHETAITEAQPDLKFILQKTDIFLASGGVSTLEACAAGIPTGVIMTADNQKAQILALEALGAISFIGQRDSLNQETFTTAWNHLQNKDYRNKLSSCSRKSIDGRGAARIAEILLQKVKQRK